MHATIRYCTGTGNTASVMALLARGLGEAGWIVDCREVFRNQVPATDCLPTDLLILGYPTLGFTAPAGFLRWVKRLPPGLGKKAIIVALCGASFSHGKVIPGLSMLGPRHVGSILRRRSWTPAGSYEISLAENWTQVCNPPDEDQCEVIRQQSLEHIEKIIHDIGTDSYTSVKRQWPRDLLGSVIAPLFLLMGRRILGLGFIADQSCNGCGFCAETCPFKAIDMRKGRPAWRISCNACNRCINLCPRSSIQMSPLRLSIHSILNLTAIALALPLGQALTRLVGPVDALISVLTTMAFSLLSFALITLVQIGPVDNIIRALGRNQATRGLFTATWTRSFRRYKAPGFSGRRKNKYPEDDILKE